MPSLSPPPAAPLSPTPAWREAALCGALVFAYVCGLLVPYPGIFDGFDFYRMVEPIMGFFQTSLGRGELPWWNPYINLGRPFLTDLGAGSFYPGSLLFVAFGPRFGLAVSIWLHGWMAVWCMARLAGRQGIPRRLALATGLALLFCGPFLRRWFWGQCGYVFGLCYVPLVFHLAGLLWEEKSPRRLAQLAVVLALQLLGGHPQISWFTGLGLGFFLIGSNLGRPVAQHLKQLLQEVGLVALAAGLAAGLCAVVLVPYAGLLQHSNRAQPVPEMTAFLPLDLRGWLSLLHPQGPQLRVDLELNLFIGIVPVLGALAAMPAAVRTPEGRGWLGVIAGATLIALAPRTPLFPIFNAALPMFATFRIHGREAALLVFAVLLLAGRGAATGGLSRYALWAGGGLAGLTLLAIAAGAGGGRASAGWLATRAFFTLGGLGVFTFLAGPRSARSRSLALALLAVLLVVDVALAAFRTKHYLPGRPVFPGEAAIAREAALCRRPEDGGAPVRVSFPGDYMRENSGMLLGYSTFTGYQPLPLDRVWYFIHEMRGLPLSPIYNASPDLAIFDEPLPFASMNLALGYVRRTGEMVVRLHPDPRAYVAPAVLTVAGWKEATARMKAGHPIQTVALAEQPVPGLPSQPPDRFSGDARILAFSLNRITVRTRASAPGLLVLKEAWYPGWTARIDQGPAVDCLPVNAWMRAVPVPGGEHRVEFSFFPRGFAAGGAVSAAALLACAWLYGRAGCRAASRR
jgi:hypothetical protein